MKKWIHHSASMAGEWLNQAPAGQPVPTSARNALVAQLAAMRDALHAPDTVLDDNGAIAFLPQDKYRGAEAAWRNQAAPVVGVLPRPSAWVCTAAIDTTSSLDGRRRATATALTRALELLVASGEVFARLGTAPAGTAMTFDGPVLVFGDAARALLPDAAEKLVREEKDIARLVWQAHTAALGVIRILARSRSNILAAPTALTSAEELAMESVYELAEQRQAEAQSANARAGALFGGAGLVMGFTIGSPSVGADAKRALGALFR